MSRHAHPLSVVAAAATLTGGVAACARYEWKNELDVPGLCPTSAPSKMPAPLSIGAPGGRVTGRVLGMQAVPVVGARVFVVSPAPGRGAFTDSAGRFALDSLPKGDYVIRARSIGYQSEDQRVVARADSGPALDFQLQPSVLDGPCSGFAAVRVRKPWWKLW
ncbi:MAG TPA: carboxypeptidase-like regulatory domain-containing protein [Bryobacteraceae bacterium]|nr:carboxypeptidase-like regulatory domain-containing protein [Bryobacteraceae bacterium]